MNYPNFPFGLSMTLVKRKVSGQDGYGNDTYTESRIVVTNCVFVPAGSSENLLFQDQVQTTDTIFMPFGTDVGPLDAIEFNGNVFEVVGEPSRWASPFSGHVSPIRVDVNKVTGVAV